jgi:hypothetical protein
MSSAHRQATLFGLALVAAAVAFASPFRQPDCNTGSHYALVQMLAIGSKTIDPVHGESCDISWWRGHYYANKAPGLALATLPWYVALKELGLTRGDPKAAASFPGAMRALPRRDLWLMGLWGAVLPALALLVLVRRVAERLVPGAGTAVAVTLGFGSLLLPFASLFFSHALAAFLAFAAFAVVLDTRGTSTRRLLAGGALAGLGVVVEYPMVLFAAALTVYVGMSVPRLRRVGSFALGVAVGSLPLALYDTWAFGSPLHLSYVGAVLHPGLTGHDVLGANTVGLFGVGVPSLAGAVHILVGDRGLVAIAPVLALAPFGCVLLWKAGWRREGAFLGAVCGLFVLYNAGYYSPLGGATPGPRFLVCVLPFSTLAIAPLVRLVPVSFLALLGLSMIVLLAAHLTQPLISHPYVTGDWWHWLRHGGYSATLFGTASHGWLVAAPVAAAAAVAFVVATSSIETRSPSRADLVAGLTALALWALAFADLSAAHGAEAGLIAAGIAIVGVVYRWPNDSAGLSQFQRSQPVVGKDSG